jgi:hypothetical protein
MGDGVRGAAVHFHVDNEFLDLRPTLWIVQTDEATAQEGHTHPHHLAWAQMAMSLG